MVEDLPRGELHSHTRASDGYPTPEEAVKLARAKGLSVLSITDHDTFRGSSLAMRIARILAPNVPIILPGIEVRTELGDILVYCSEPHPSAPKDVESLREWASENNCVMIAAHPFHPARHSLGKRIYDILDILDGLEVWNSRGIPVFNYKAIKLGEELSGKVLTSGSDAHVPREYGVSPTIFLEPVESVEDALEAVRKGRVKPTLGVPGPIVMVQVMAWAVMKRLGLH